MRSDYACLVAVILSTVSCSDDVGNGEPPTDEVRSPLSREQHPDVSDDALATLADGDRVFALDVYAELVRERPDSGLFFSPYSISLALAMTYPGAAGDTASAMASTLHFELEEPTLHAAFNSVDLALTSRGQGARGKDDQPFQLHLTNSIWGEQSVTFLEPFLDTLAVNYGAGLHVVDFVGEPEESRKLINTWVEDQTAMRIVELLPPDSINAGTLMVLVNAIYFSAAWETKFRKEATQSREFTTLGGSVVSVPMMGAVDNLGYYAGSGVHAVEKYYDGHQLTMVLIVPDAGSFARFEADLDNDGLRAILNGLERKSGLLQMPKWQFEGPTLALAALFEALGMGIAFSARADFSRLSHEPTMIGNVYHQAFIAVDESGTEASAGTAVVLGGRGAPALDFELTVDRPFIYLIRDVATDTIVFMGRVVDPSR